MIKLSLVALQLPDGAFALQRRSKGAKFSPGKLGFFGGHGETGEQPHDTALRELHEETSLDTDSLTLQFVGEFEMESDAGQGTLHFTLYKAGVETADFSVYEGVRAETYTKREALSRSDLTPSVSYAFEKLLA